jgi:hypothetical protein
MPVRRMMRAAPEQPPVPVLVPVEESAQKARPVHRETRPCNLPGCIITWIPAHRPLCDMHWFMLPWQGKYRWEAAYRKKLRKAQAIELANIIIYLLLTLEQDSVPMPEGHQLGPAAGWECGCVACVKIRERAERIVAERYPKPQGAPDEHPQQSQ